MCSWRVFQGGLYTQFNPDQKGFSHPLTTKVNEVTLAYLVETFGGPGSGVSQLNGDNFSLRLNLDTLENADYLNSIFEKHAPLAELEFIKTLQQLVADHKAYDAKQGETALSEQSVSDIIAFIKVNTNGFVSSATLDAVVPLFQHNKKLSFDEIEITLGTLQANAEKKAHAFSLEKLAKEYKLIPEEVSKSDIQSIIGEIIRMRISNPKTLQIAQSDFSTYFGAKEGQTGRDVQEKSTLQILGLSSIGTLASLASIALFYKMYKQSTKKAELKDFAKDVTADWTKRAANREHYLGRKDEVQRAFREIRQEYSSVIFDGASGAGKDFVAYEWFLEKERVRLGLSQNPDVPKALADAPIFEINAEAFQADTKYFGQIAEKIVAIEKQIRAETNPAEKSKLQKTLHALTLKKAREAKVVKKLHRLNALLAGETDPAKKATLEARINKLNLKLAVSVAPEISGALRSGKIIVLYMPEIDKVLLHGTSEGTSQSSQAAGMFLSLLDRYKQQVVMVGTTSRAERLQTAVDDITRRANWIKIHPFTPSKLKNVIVNGPSKAGWEKDHKVNISPEAVDAAIKLTEHFYRPTTLKPNGRYTPRFNAVASIMVSASQRAFARDGAGTAVTIEDVIAAVAEKVGKELPEAEVRETLAVTNPDTLMIDAVSGKHSIEERTKKHIRERIITLDPGLNKAEVKARTRVMSALWNRVKANVEQRNYYFDIDGFKTGDFGAPLVPASFMNITANSHEYQSQVAALESALARQASAEATSEKMKALRTELFKQPWFNGLHPERRSEIMRYALQEIQVSDPTWDHTHPLTDGFLLKLQEHLTNMESLPGRARRAVEPEGRRSSIVLSEDDGFHPAGAPRK